MSEKTLVNELDKLVEDSNIYNKEQLKTQKELNEENEVLRECIESELDDVTVEGTEIEIEDAANYYGKMTIKGNTEQQSYEGKNKININSVEYYPVLYKYINTIKGNPIIDENIITFNSNSDNQCRLGIIVELKQNTTYTISMTSIKGYDANNTLISESVTFAKLTSDFSIENGLITRVGDGTTAKIQNNSFSFTTDENTSQLIYMNVFVKVSKLIIENFMIEEGSTATDYEPYVGGEPSPNRNYPQDIHVVSGKNTIGVNSKNLYNASKIPIKSNGLTWGADKQYIYLNGKRTNSSSCNFPTQKLKAGTYTLIMELKSGSIKSSSTGALFYIYGAVSVGGFVIKDTAPKARVKFTLNKEGSIYLHLWSRTTETCKDAKIAYQIIKGDLSDYDFVPYYHKDYPLTLESLQMLNIGTHKDEFVLKDGNWIIPNKVQKIDSYNGEEITTEYISTTGGLDEGAIVYYVGTEDYVVEDETLIKQLNELYNHLKMVKGTNIITIIPQDLPPNMELTYKKSIQSQINELKAMVLDS